MQMVAYDPKNKEHQQIVQILGLETVLDEPYEASQLQLIKTDDGLDCYTYLQPDGRWYVHSIDFEEDVPFDADTKEEACRLICSLQ